MTLEELANTTPPCRPIWHEEGYEDLQPEETRKMTHERQSTLAAARKKPGNTETIDKILAVRRYIRDMLLEDDNLPLMDLEPAVEAVLAASLPVIDLEDD